MGFWQFYRRQGFCSILPAGLSQLGSEFRKLVFGSKIDACESGRKKSWNIVDLSNNKYIVELGPKSKVDLLLILQRKWVTAKFQNFSRLIRTEFSLIFSKSSVENEAKKLKNYMYTVQVVQKFMQKPAENIISRCLQIEMKMLNRHLIICTSNIMVRGWYRLRNYLLKHIVYLLCGLCFYANPFDFFESFFVVEFCMKLKKRFGLKVKSFK